MLAALVACLALACNPLDPDKIEAGGDGGGGGKVCSPACSNQQYCLLNTSGGCECFQACAASNCSGGQLCVTDGTQYGCYEASKVKCQ